MGDWVVGLREWLLCSVDIDDDGEVDCADRCFGLGVGVVDRLPRLRTDCGDDERRVEAGLSCVIGDRVRRAAFACCATFAVSARACSASPSTSADAK